MELRKGRYGKFYGCTRWPACDGVNGANQTDGRPLGVLADKETRELRVRVHELLDNVWLGERERRREARAIAYEWLARFMRLPAEKCHVSMFTKKQCERAIEILSATTISNEGD